MAKGATPGVIEGAAEGLSDPTTQQKVVDAIEPGRVREATDKMGSGLADGVLDTLEDEKRQERMGALADRLVTRSMATLTDPEKTAPLEQMIARIVSGSVGSAIDAGMNRMLAEPTQERVRGVTRALVSDVIHASFDAVGDEMGTPETRKQMVGDLVHEVSKQATLGFQAAIDEERAKRDARGAEGSEGSLLVAAGDAAQKGKSYLFYGAIGLGFVVMVLGGFLISALKKRRTHRSDLAQRDDALLMLMETIKSSEGQPWGNELREHIKKSARDREGGDYLRRVLRQRSELRFGTALPAPSPAAGGNGTPAPSRYQHHS